MFQDFEKSEDILTLGCAARFGGEDLAADDDLEDEDSLYYVARASGQSVGAGGGSSAGGKASIKHYPFDYCWDKAQENRANPVPIPGKPNFKKKVSHKSQFNPSIGLRYFYFSGTFIQDFRVSPNFTNLKLKFCISLRK